MKFSHLYSKVMLDTTTLMGMGSMGVKVKTFFSRKCIKYSDLHRNVLFANHHLHGDGIGAGDVMIKLQKLIC